VGAGLVTLLALWAPMIRGHGIPEAMEAALEKENRISVRAATTKPLSAAIAIGTGGPFGAEGPIIVTGGAIGSLLGQVLGLSPSERKILLACDAAAGMAATFGAPLASVVLAIELLLFEFSMRALVPLLVALASGTSGGTLAPLLMISGSFGALLGHAVGNVLPGWHGGPGTIAVVAMAATFGHASYPIVDAGGRCIGIVGRDDLLAAGDADRSARHRRDARDRDRRITRRLCSWRWNGSSTRT
jgi:H+/Cl- antiporter ClcA